MSGLDKRLTRILDSMFCNRANKTRHKNFHKKWKKREKQKEKNKQAKLPITELFDLEHKGKLK